MELMELALRRYRELVPDPLRELHPAQRYWQLPMARLQGWLADYVVPAVEDVSRRPTFRAHATWSRRMLGRGAATPERAAIDEVDQALRGAAQALQQLSRRRLVARRLDALAARSTSPSPRAWSSAEPDRDRDNTLRLEELFSGIPVYRSQLASIAAGEAWTDLACLDDYLGPVGGMRTPQPSSPPATEGSLIVSLQPRLFFIGESITRCLLQRIRSWRSALEEARAVIYAALRHIRHAYAAQTDAERSAWETLHRLGNALETICLHGSEARLRDTCVGAVQLYAEFHPAPDLAWLGLEPWVLRRAQGMLRHNLYSTRDLESFERIAGVLSGLRRLYRDADPQQSDLEAAIATGDLVIVDQPTHREAHWETRPIKVDWFRHKKPWKLLCQLARKGRLGSPVSHLDLYDEGVVASTMANRWRRLKERLPATLTRYVQPGEETATYLLTLSIDRIHLD